MIRAPPRSTRTDTRVPYTTLCRSCESRSCRLLPFTDHYGRVVGERIGRHGQVERGRASADAPGGVVVGAMAGAEPAAEDASVLARLMAQRPPAAMGAAPEGEDPPGLQEPLRKRARNGERPNN